MNVARAQRFNLVDASHESCDLRHVPPKIRQFDLADSYLADLASL